ncbi:MAG TPA: serine/threonine-protein kinase [Chroococcidiopsis sp.]
MTDPNIGRSLSNRYQLSELLGQGAMGRVYGARDMLLGGVPVAVKFLAQTLLNQKMRDRFEREAMTCALLGQRSIHIVRVTDYGVDDDEVPYYVMEYLKGDSLSEIITRQPISLPRFLNLSRQICLGLHCAHQGIPIDGEVYAIVHRDIKPSNILICQDESLGELAKILDFGIAKVLQADSDQTNCFMGTLAYSSPEQMEGQELDGRADIYSLGVMMFQMLTGKMPLQADTHTFGGWYKAHHHQPPRSFADVNSGVKLPKALENLVMSCLSKSPSDRPQTAWEVLKTLEPLEQRFGTGRQVGQRIAAALSKLPVTTTPRTPSLSTPEEVCKFTSWPSTKPIAEIVFPHSIRTTKETLATLWVMLRREEIEKRQVCTRYNQFLFLPSPHPTILWLTVLYNREHGPRWLPCYLDLKTTQGQQMIRLLGQSGQYRLLFFAKEDPKRCHSVQISSIAASQCKMLMEWATMAQMAPSTFQFGYGKSHLKTELEKLKPMIEMKLESLYEEGSDLSG